MWGFLFLCSGFFETTGGKKITQYCENVLLQKLKEINARETIEVKIISGSMEPLIKTGEVVRVEKLSGDPRPFDILVFYQNNIFLCHYFWRKNIRFDNDGKNYLTRPLLSRGVDIPFARGQILGRVRGKKIGFWRRMLIMLRDIR